ncbi:MAG: hypothetical protein ACI8Z1_000293 [Candidatus Azotimanducaceae bacterium]
MLGLVCKLLGDWCGCLSGELGVCAVFVPQGVGLLRSFGKPGCGVCAALVKQGAGETFSQYFALQNNAATCADFCSRKIAMGILTIFRFAK